MLSASLRSRRRLRPRREIVCGLLPWFPPRDGLRMGLRRRQSSTLRASQDKRPRTEMRRFILHAAALASALLSGGACGQTFPSKPIRVVIPFVAGGSSDIVGRAIAAKFQEILGQPGIVENKPGANGAIPPGFGTKPEPDGYPILVGSTAVFSVNQALSKDLGYQTPAFR